jgi:hypothetical protein
LLKFYAKLFLLVELVILVSEEDRALYELFINQSHATFRISIYDIAILPYDAIAATLDLEIDSDQGSIWLGLREQGRGWRDMD